MPASKIFISFINAGKMPDFKNRYRKTIHRFYTVKMIHFSLNGSPSTIFSKYNIYWGIVLNKLYNNVMV